MSADDRETMRAAMARLERSSAEVRACLLAATKGLQAAIEALSHLTAALAPLLVARWTPPKGSSPGEGGGR